MEKKSFIEKYAKILVIVAVFCGGASGPLAAKITASALIIGLGRLTVALPFFAVPALKSPEQREALRKLPRRTVLLCGLTGVFLFLHFVCWFTAVKYANVSAAAVLAAFHPLVVLAITVFVYKKKVPGKAIVAIVIALAAGAYMTCSDLSAFSDGRAIGYILAFMS
ncbi:MAG: DMT family transporter, partial [Firmicutes bacterium]|nr:DMT family transporter [Bacillota bacterium]